MNWLTKPKKLYLDMVVSWLRSEIAKLSHVLMTIEDAQNYHNDFLIETIKTTETELRRIRKFIEAN